MTKRFATIQAYHDHDPSVTVTTKRIGGVVLSSMQEFSNAIVIEQTRWHSVLLSVSGSAMHRGRIGDAHRTGPLRDSEVALVPADVRMQSAWETAGHLLHTVAVEFDTGLFRTYSPELYSDSFARGTLRAAVYHPNQPLSALMSLLARELDAERQMGRLFSDELFRLLAFELAARSWSVPTRLAAHGNRTDRRIGAAVDYIEANFRRDISLTDIAAAAGMGPTHLTDRFRAQTGQTPYAYVIERRVAAAVHMLRHTDLPIAHISSDIGFADQQHLTRAIRARLGTTPRGIRLGKDRT